MADFAPAFLPALAISASFSVVAGTFLVRLTSFTRFSSKVTTSILFFSLSAILFLLAIIFPIQIPIIQKFDLFTLIGLIFFIFGWGIIVYICYCTMRWQPIRDILRWRTGLLRRYIGEKIFGKSINLEDYFGSPPSGFLKLRFLRGKLKQKLPKGCIFLLHGHNNLDMRYFAYQVCIEQGNNSYIGFVSLNQPAWSILNFDKLKNKFKTLITDNRFWIIDIYTDLFGKGEIASFREWELKKIHHKVGKRDEYMNMSNIILKGRDIFDLHTNIRWIRRYADAKEGGPGNSNNKIIFIHNDLHMMDIEGDETSVVYYATHAAPLEKQMGCIDIFILPNNQKNSRLFNRLYELADVVINFSDEYENNELKKYLKIEKADILCDRSKIQYELDSTDNENFINIK